MLSKAKSRMRQTVLDRICRQLMASDPGGKRAPFGPEELKLLREALISQNLCCIDGQMVTQFERKFAFAYGVPYAVASTSGTAAIHLALGALNFNPGAEVITAPVTDMGTIIPILSQGAIPVFADVDETLNMDPRSVEKCITPRTKAIIAVHLFGNPCDMDAMVEVAKRHNVARIEDCAQAHWTEYKGRLVGTIGDIGCFSFQQSKHMTTGDGGMTITSNPAYHERMKLFADKGYSRKGWGARAYLFHAPNYRMNELVGAVGLAQLQKVKGVVDRRRELAEYMTGLIASVPGVEPLPVTAGSKPSFWLYPVRLTEASAENFANEMRRRKFWVTAGYTGKPIYLCSESLTEKRTYGDSQWPFTANPDVVYEYKEGLCPRAEKALEQLVCVPLDESHDRAYVERMATAIADTMKALGGERVPAPQSTAATTVHVSTPTRSTGQRVKVAIIGCGQMGRWHLDAYKSNPHVEFVGFVDTSLDRAEKFAREVGGRAYRSHTELLQAPIDAVSLCTVPASHHDIAIDLLRGGANVLCEKPLAISVIEAEDMSRHAAQANRLLFTAFKFRFHDEVRKAKELIDSGSLGRILNFRLMFGGYIDMTGQWYAQKALSGGGIIMDNGPHAADLMHYLFGKVRSVSATASRIQNLEVEDTAKLDVSLDNQTVGTTDLSWSVRIPAQAYLEIYGEDGAAALDGEGISYRFKTWSEWKRVPNQLDSKAAFAAQINYFVDAVLGSNPLSLGNGEGVASQRVIAAAYESVERERRVNIQTSEVQL